MRASGYADKPVNDGMHPAWCMLENGIWLPADTWLKPVAKPHQCLSVEVSHDRHDGIKAIRLVGAAPAACAPPCVAQL